MSDAVTAQVVVVGGGPVGLLIAAELGAFGVDTVVCEARSTVSDAPKANTLHARTVQSLTRRGYLDAPAAGAASERPFHFAGMPGLTMTSPAGEPEPLMKRLQADLERSFEALARERGVRVLRGHRVVRVRQDADGVVASAEGPDGPTELRAEYLVGADGPRGVVRTEAGMGSETFPATVAALMGLVRLRDPEALPPGWHMTRRGWVVSRDTPEGLRLVRTVNCSGEHPDRRVPVTLEELAAEVSLIAGHEVAFTEGRHLTRFSDFTRIADSFRAGRVFLAGDAAHLHFPIGGQGLSTGLLDALNLAWKLALAVRGSAGKDLLDTYDLERRPAARRVVDNTRAQLALMRPEAGLDPLRTLVTDLLADPAHHGYLAGLISAQDTRYVARSVSGSQWEGRFLDNTALTTPTGPQDVIGLLRDGRPTLLLTGAAADRYATAAAAWSPVLRTVRVAAGSALPCEALLVRPDGYLAWAQDGDDLTETLRTWFGEPC
ncbi:FAD-dependent monooxygenase [Streptomyces sp. NPDC059002]|uniref:FAD-dependent monooxygenase n=1 Tax=Streptomyces sp. NPDC059002 TaxID=3346690 RepID=UPI003683E9D4